MSTTRPDATADPDALAERLTSTALVKLVPRADGDAIAAAGTVAQGLQNRGIPFQISPAATRADRRDRVTAGDDALTVAVGHLDGADATIDAAAATVSESAVEVATALGEIEQPELPLAGIVAGGGTPGSAPDLFEHAQERGLEQHPGIASPVADLADGLAHSTLVHTPASGDEGRARELLETLGIDPADPDAADRRAVASLAAIDGTDTDAPERAANTIGRFVAPYATPAGPFETLGGYADVLDALAYQAPGTAVALAIGGDVYDPALTAWREHASALHEAVRTASVGRYDGFVVLRSSDGPVAAVARRYRDIATVEPVVLAVGDTEVGVATTAQGTADEPTRAIRDAVGGTADWSPRDGVVLTNEPIDEHTVIEAVRGSL